QPCCFSTSGINGTVLQNHNSALPKLPVNAANRVSLYQKTTTFEIPLCLKESRSTLKLTP
ncbi:hypothetical protein, partial [uncultured Chryseobacterium sp.]|uniref:hypothetical protein n=1 Tax=uncultured Chryseobacterium sp. TaxID=259322 RepID=UPI00258C2FAA